MPHAEHAWQRRSSQQAAAPASAGAPARARRQVDLAPGLIFGLLAIGETRVEGLLEGEDVLRTAEACRALGATVTREAPGRWRIPASASAGSREPAGVARFRQCRAPARA